MFWSELFADGWIGGRRAWQSDGTLLMNRKEGRRQGRSQFKLSVLLSFPFTYLISLFFEINEEISQLKVRDKNVSVFCI